MNRLKMLLRMLLVVLALNIRQISCGGKFRLELIQFNNDYGLLDDDTCCQGQLVDNICTEQCNTYFRICFKHFQREVTAGQCTYGDYTTIILGNNSFQFPSERGVFTNPLEFPFSFAWKGDFSLIIQAYHESSITTSEVKASENLIAQFNGSKNVRPADGWSVHRWNATSTLGTKSLQFKYQIACDTNYYGPDCSMICTPRNDELGHYECGSDGQRVCRQGWQGEYCDKAICLEGCDSEHGHCSRPNECSCRSGWGGRFCDQCLTYPGCENGYCVDKFDCICYDGWGGMFCNQDLNYCTNHKPCKNGGTCTNTGEGSYTCTCPVGYTGTNCEIEVDNCQLQPCENGGVCRDVGNDFICECPVGFAGIRCEMSVAKCTENPCANGGTCEPINDSYRCHCVAGWGGVDCRQQRNECDSQPCLNGGRCIDELNGYRCTCPQGFSGALCQVNMDECAGENPCQNGGRCIDGDNEFLCRCQPGFIGSICEIDVDDCVTRPCANGGSCRDRVNDFECFCAPGYTGRMCSEEINECASNPCLYGGSCEDRVNGFVCHCANDREGKRCEYRQGEAPSTTTSPTMPSTSTPVIIKPVAGKPSATNTAASTDDKADSTNNIVFTRTQLILVVCFGCGIPLCLLLLFVSILLYRRWKKKAIAKSEEARQNEANNMNNRIHNNTGSVHGDAEQQKCDSSYPTEKSLTDMEIFSQREHQLRMSYRNSANAPFLDKLAHKDYIKNLNAVNDRQTSHHGDSATSAENLKQYGCHQQPVYNTSGNNSFSRNSSTPYSTISSQLSRTSAADCNVQQQFSELTYIDSNRPATKQNNKSRSYDDGSTRTISTISSAAVHTLPDYNSCDSSYRSQSQTSHEVNSSTRSSQSQLSIAGGSSYVSGYATNSPSPCSSPQHHLEESFCGVASSLSNATTV